jgi:hypothetical protein
MAAGFRIRIVIACLVGTTCLAQTQNRTLLPGTWPLGNPAAPRLEATPLAPLPDRSIAVPDTSATTPGWLPGVGLEAGMIGEGLDPTRRTDGDRIRPSDRDLPREAQDQPRAVPGMTLTVPFSP